MDLNANGSVFLPIDIINLITSTKKTGALYIDVYGENGEIYFQNGIPVHAEYKGLKGIEAIYNLALENVGTIQYKDGVNIKEHSIEQVESGELINNIEKRKIEFDKIKSKLPPFDAILEKKADGVYENVALRKTDWAMIRLINGKRDIKTLIKESKMPALEVCQSLQWLIDKGMIFDKSLSERLIKSLGNILNNILDVFSVKGTNTKDWFDYLQSVLSNNGYETLSGMINLNNEKIVVDDNVSKIIDEEKLNKIKELLYENALLKANEELGKMIAKKKYNELIAKEGER